MYTMLCSVIQLWFSVLPYISGDMWGEWFLPYRGGRLQFWSKQHCKWHVRTCSHFDMVYELNKLFTVFFNCINLAISLILQCIGKCEFTNYPLLLHVSVTGSILLTHLHTCYMILFLPTFCRHVLPTSTWWNWQSSNSVSYAFAMVTSICT